MKPYKVVYTSGSWDLFHIGHLRLINKSKEFGSKLIVGVSTDELIESYKGSRPVIPFQQRAEIISAISGVDLVVKQDTLLDPNLLKEHKVDIVTIGDDWLGKSLPGLDYISKNGKIYYLPYTKDISTTSIKRKIIDNIYDIVRSDIRREEEYILKI